MNILVSVNSKFLIPLKTLLFSLSHTQKEKCKIYLLNLSLTLEELNKVKQFCEFLSFEIHIFNMSKNISLLLENKVLDLEKSKLSCETYFRLFAPSLFPSLNKILWLDADCLVRKDLSSFYYQDMGGKLIASCDHCNYLIPEIPECSFYERPERKRSPEYFNAGVILFNLDSCRKFKNFNVEVVKSFIQNSNTLTHPCFDQSILNQMIPSSLIKWENPLLYNCRANLGESLGPGGEVFQYKIYEKAYILHYCSPLKPWDLLREYDPILRNYWIEEYIEVLKIEKNFKNQKEKN